jgi:hypothetical protein
MPLKSLLPFPLNTSDTLFSSVPENHSIYPAPPRCANASGIDQQQKSRNNFDVIRVGSSLVGKELVRCIGLPCSPCCTRQWCKP